MMTLTDIERRIAAARLRRRMAVIVTGADRARHDRRVRRETRRAAMHAKRATNRIRRIGPARAVRDRCVTVQLGHARRHAVRAVGLAAHPRPSHRTRNVVLASAAAAAAAGAAYAGLRSATASTDEAHAAADAPGLG